MEMSKELMNYLIMLKFLGGMVLFIILTCSVFYTLYLIPTTRVYLDKIINYGADE